MFSSLLIITICWTFVERAQRSKLKMFSSGSDVTHCFSLDFWRDKFQESFKLSLSRRGINYIICKGSNKKTFKNMKWNGLKRAVVFISWRNGHPVDQGLFIIEVSRSHSDTPHSVGLIWTSDQTVAGTSTWKHNIHKRQTSITPAGFEPIDPRLKPCGHWDRPEVVVA